MAILTSNFVIDGLILTFVAIIAAYAYMTRKFLYWTKRGVMEIPPIPFIGNFADCITMKKSPGEFVKELYDRSANLPYMGFYIFDKPFFLIRDPELVRNVVTRDFNYFTDRFATAEDSLGAPTIFFLNNPGWKLVRTKLTPIFTSGKLRKMFQLMLKVGEDLKTHMNSLGLEEGRVVECKELCARYSTDIIGSTAFGLDVNCLNNPNAEFRARGYELFDYTLWRSLEVTSLFFAPQFGKILGLRFFTDKNSDFMRRIVQDTMASREISGEKRGDMIDRLMEIRKMEADSPNNEFYKFEGDNLVAQAAAFFAAGFETVSTAVSFTMYELALAPKIQDRLRKEIKDALKDNEGEITYDLIMSLPYLDMVVSETLRKYPSLPFLDRVTIADYKIPNTDLILEKGTPVYIPMLGLHYDPEYFPNPDVYDPERFSEENKRNLKPYVYMPFGEGPRICIGMRFALLETKLATIHILSEYELSPCEKTLIPMRLDPKALLMKADGGLDLKIRKLAAEDDV